MKFFKTFFQKPNNHIWWNIDDEKCACVYTYHHYTDMKIKSTKYYKIKKKVCINENNVLCLVMKLNKKQKQKGRLIFRHYHKHRSSYWELERKWYIINFEERSPKHHESFDDFVSEVKIRFLAKDMMEI